jgi:PhoD-like phosphatase
MLGDQVYADEASPKTREFMRTRRDISKPPYEEVADFEEYCRLYQESWSVPLIRWFFSTVSTAMIWDDHDVHDDWNTSEDWVEEMRRKPWWNDRIVGATMAYWLYQHWGNLSPRELDDDEVFCKVCETDGDAGSVLRTFAFESDRSKEGVRWTYCRDIGSTRIVVMDSRGGRIVEPDRREMIDDDEWRFIERHACEGGFDHLVLATTLPVLMPPALHWLEAWDEAVSEGAWGKRWEKWGEKIRQGLDLEHWSAFHDSFLRLMGLVRDVGSGRRGTPPASIVFLSGDIHNAYLARASFKAEDRVQTPVWQGVCSPIRNPLDAKERRMFKLACSRPAHKLAKALAHRAGVKDAPFRWKLTTKPSFDNQISTMDWHGEWAELTLERSVPGEPRHPKLEKVRSTEIAGGRPRAAARGTDASSRAVR